MLILHKFFKQTEREGTNSSYEASITLILKLDKIQEKYKPISFMNIYIYIYNSKQNFNKSNPDNILKRKYIRWGSSQECKVALTFKN